MIDFVWENFDNPKLKQLKDQCSLNEVISKGSSEFEKQLILKDWTFKKLPHGGNYRDYSDTSSFEILKDQQIGMSFQCTQYCQLFLQAAISLGWYVRKLSIDCDHEQNEQDMHHGICDIWSNDFKKWIVIDPMHNLHYEKNGVPLNSFEIRKNYLDNKATSTKGVIGNKDSELDYSVEQKGFNTPSNYFWFLVALRNNFFEKPGLFNTPVLLWNDNFNQNKIWYKDSKPNEFYDYEYFKTDDLRIAFPAMNYEK